MYNQVSLGHSVLGYPELSLGGRPAAPYSSSTSRHRSRAGKPEIQLQLQQQQVVSVSTARTRIMSTLIEYVPGTGTTSSSTLVYSGSLRSTRGNNEEPRTKLEIRQHVRQRSTSHVLGHKTTLGSTHNEEQTINRSSRLAERSGAAYCRPRYTSHRESSVRLFHTGR